MNLLKNLMKNLPAKIHDSHRRESMILCYFLCHIIILDLALNAELTLYQYAYDKQIYLTTPHTLFMALKTINISWTYVESDEKVREAFGEMGKIYDKFELLCKDFKIFVTMSHFLYDTERDSK